MLHRSLTRPSRFIPRPVEDRWNQWVKVADVGPPRQAASARISDSLSRLGVHEGRISHVTKHHDPKDISQHLGAHNRVLPRQLRRPAQRGTHSSCGTNCLARPAKICSGLQHAEVATTCAAFNLHPHSCTLPLIPSEMLRALGVPSAHTRAAGRGQPRPPASQLAVQCPSSRPHGTPGIQPMTHCYRLGCIGTTPSWKGMTILWVRHIAAT